MKTFKVHPIVMMSLILTATVSCGDGSTGGTTAGGGVGGTGISVGKITAFGSVFVNGVEFDTAGAAITVNSDPATQADLGIGMVVTVRGSIDDGGATGTADSIDYESEIEGPIDSMDPAAETLVVLGQTVATDGSTVYEDVAGFSSLTAGNVIEVSGFVDFNGTIMATRIELESDTFTPNQDTVEIKGAVGNLDTSLKTFRILNQAVNYGDPNVVLEVPGGVLTDGMLVEVKGTLDTSTPPILNAVKIEAQDTSLGGVEGDELEIEGFVNQWTSESDFEVNGQRVQTTSQTQFENGAAGGIQLNVLLEVEGSLDANGVLIAREISFK